MSERTAHKQWGRVSKQLPVVTVLFTVFVSGRAEKRANVSGGGKLVSLANCRDGLTVTLKKKKHFSYLLPYGQVVKVNWYVCKMKRSESGQPPRGRRDEKRVKSHVKEPASGNFIRAAHQLGCKQTSGSRTRSNLTTALLLSLPKNICKTLT